MIVEDFTHVVPEDKPIHRKRNEELFNKIFDLEEVNKKAIHIKNLQKHIAQIELQARNKYAAKLVSGKLTIML